MGKARTLKRLRHAIGSDVVGKSATRRIVKAYYDIPLKHRDEFMVKLKEQDLPAQVVKLKAEKAARDELKPARRQEVIDGLVAAGIPLDESTRRCKAVDEMAKGDEWLNEDLPMMITALARHPQWRPGMPQPVDHGDDYGPDGNLDDVIVKDAEGYQSNLTSLNGEPLPILPDLTS